MPQRPLTGLKTSGFAVDGMATVNGPGGTARLTRTAPLRFGDAAIELRP